MLEILQENFNSFSSFAVNTFILNFAFALLLCVPVCMGYKLTFSARAYNKRFLITLALTTIVAAVVVSVIADNVAIAILVLAAVFALRVKLDARDPRYPMFMVWAVAVGICCGLSLYIQAIVASIAVCIALVAIGKVRHSGKYMLVIKTLPSYQRVAEESVSAFYGNAAKLRMRNASRDSAELIYDISRKDVNKYAQLRGNSITEVMLQLEGVKSIDLVSASLDMLG